MSEDKSRRIYELMIGIKDPVCGEEIFRDFFEKILVPLIGRPPLHHKEKLKDYVSSLFKGKCRSFHEKVWPFFHFEENTEKTHKGFVMELCDMLPGEICKATLVFLEKIWNDPENEEEHVKQLEASVRELLDNFQKNLFTNNEKKKVSKVQVSG